jgi:chromosome segregation ATPase
MAKGGRKVQNDDDSSGDDNASDDENDSDSDEEFESPSYDELVKLLNQYTKIIRKIRAKNEKLELENDSLLAKYDVAQKASDEFREENKIMSSKLKELKTSKKELREKHNKLEEMHNELTTSYKLLKEEYTSLKINNDNLVLSHEFLSNEPHDATNNVVKIDIATSCDDLIVESIEQGSSSKGKKVVESDNCDDYIKLKNENEKLKKDLKKASTSKKTPLSLRILTMIMIWLLKMRCLEKRTKDSRWRWVLRSK